MYKVQLTTFALFLLFLAKPVPADPVPDPLFDIWDNINGTAGEPLSSNDIYLADEHKIRVSAEVETFNTSDFYDSTGTKISDSVFNYNRINLPISIEYGIPGLFEVGFRMPFVVRSSHYEYWSNTSGWGDFSLRIRKRIYGEKDGRVYLALGGGIKFPTAKEVDIYDGLPLSYGSLDFFLGAYSIIRTGVIKYPIALTYSHTGRGQYGAPVSEIITYQLGFQTDFGNFVDLHIGLKGYEITNEYSTEFDEYLPQGISKTSVEGDLVITTLENRVNFSAGLAYDLRGKRSYAGISPVFSMQVNF
jgi:hypothetical protein